MTSDTGYGIGLYQVARQAEMLGLTLRLAHNEPEEVLFEIRGALRIRAMLEIWLFIHIPLTIALIAALTAHVISVFFYW